jgi:uncharacterized membrane protein
MTDRRLTRALAAAALMLAAISARAADPPPPQRLIYAVYPSESTASDVFKALRSAEDRGQIRLDSYAVLTKGPDGKISIKEQRRKATAAGATVGEIVGLIGEGPAAGAAGVATGSPAGHPTSPAVSLPPETAHQIKDSLARGETAIIAVVDDQWAAEVERLQRAEASRIITHPVPTEPPSTTGKTPNPLP